MADGYSSTTDPEVATYLKEIAEHLGNIEKTICADDKTAMILSLATNLFQNNYCEDGNEKKASKQAISKASAFYKILVEYGLISED